MPIALPRPLPANTGWMLAGYSKLNLNSSVAAGGQGCTITVGPVPPDEVWEIDRLSVSCSVSPAGSCLLYEDQVHNAQLIDGTGDGSFDVDDCNSPIRLLSASELLIVWPTAPDGAVGSARLQFRRLRRSPG